MKLLSKILKNLVCRLLVGSRVSRIKMLSDKKISLTGFQASSFFNGANGTLVSRGQH